MVKVGRFAHQGVRGDREDRENGEDRGAISSKFLYKSRHFFELQHLIKAFTCTFVKNLPLWAEGDGAYKLLRRPQKTAPPEGAEGAKPSFFILIRVRTHDFVKKLPL